MCKAQILKSALHSDSLSHLCGNYNKNRIKIKKINICARHNFWKVLFIVTLYGKFNIALVFQNFIHTHTRTHTHTHTQHIYSICVVMYTYICTVPALPTHSSGHFGNALPGAKILKKSALYSIFARNFLYSMYFRSIIRIYMYYNKSRPFWQRTPTNGHFGNARPRGAKILKSTPHSDFK